ncbi:MAG: nucleotidyltransferase [Microcoleaceae cyanobacterium MO_207.B10]|nr:nucleotidyltransferase [Microcoleaceae cyanobacterium MO_207.B10]
MRDDRERLIDMLEAIYQIEKYAIQGKDRFTGDELIQTWMVHHLMIIGEAASKMSEETRQRYPNIPFS